MFTNKIYLIPLYVSVSSQISSINLQIRSDPVTRIFPKLSFNDKGWSADSAAWFVPRLNRTFLPFIRKIHPVRGEKIHTTATSYRHATWPRFQWNNLICAYIYIPQWWSWCIGFVQAWIAANCTTDQCNRSQPCENGNFTRISLLRLTYLHIAPYVA